MASNSNSSPIMEQHPPLSSSLTTSYPALCAVVITHRHEHDNAMNEGIATTTTKNVKVVRITLNNQHVPPPATFRNSSRGNGRHTDMSTGNDAAGGGSGKLSIHSEILVQGIKLGKRERNEWGGWWG